MNHGSKQERSKEEKEREIGEKKERKIEITNAYYTGTSERPTERPQAVRKGSSVENPASAQAAASLTIRFTTESTE
jgi:hypothetical protein